MANVKPTYVSTTDGTPKPVDTATDAVSANAVYVQTSSTPDTQVGMSRDGSNNLVMADPVTGSKTLAQLAVGSGGTVTSVSASSPISVANPTTTPAITLGTVPIANGGTATTTAPTSGQLLIGKTDGTYAVAGLTAGSNVTITPGDGAVTIAATGGGGSLVNWTEAVSTAAPNATVPVDSFTATNAATDVDAALVAKGTGATLAQVPNNSSPGGNKRGEYATDWQKSRTGASEVASGYCSAIAGGYENTASGGASTVSGGHRNTASGGYSAVAGGNDNTASGEYSAVAGGQKNTASIDNSTVAGGYSNTASGQCSAIAGGYANTASGDYSTVAGGRGNAASNGHSNVAGGYSNTASGQYSAIAGGSGSTASGSNSTIAGGKDNGASGQYSAIAGGNGNTAIALGAAVVGGAANAANGEYSVILGGTKGSARSIAGKMAFPGKAATAGASQMGVHITRAATNLAGPYIVDLTVDGNALTTASQVNALPNSSTYALRCLIVGRSSTDSVAWEITGCIKRGASAGTTTFVGAPAVTTLGADAGASAWTASLIADTTYGAPVVRVNVTAAPAAASFVCTMYTTEAG